MPPSRNRIGLAAEALASVAELVDVQLSPVGVRGIDALGPAAGSTVLDIGCGAGQTVLQLADRVGPAGRVTGVDIARPLLDLARRRAAGRCETGFVESDAQDLALPGNSIDGIFSRFGVMAFDDPVAAFENFRRMLRPSGRLAFVCWRALGENELDLLPLRAAGLEAWLAPAPFSLADPARVQAVLQAAGFGRVTIIADTRPVSCGGLDATLSVLLKVGPLGRILRENPHLRAATEPRVRAALAGRETPAGVALDAATWIVTAAS